MADLAPADSIMNPQALGEELSELLATEVRSLSRHLDSSTPYLTAKTYPMWHDIQHFSEASNDHAKRLSELIDTFELPERTKTFDPLVANYHFMSLSFLIPLLIGEKTKQIAAYGRAVSHAGSNDALREALEQLRAENQEQLSKLESFSSKL